MKNAANCVKYGELQGSRNRYMSNAYGAFIFMMEARLSEGLLNGIDHLLSSELGWLKGLRIHSSSWRGWGASSWMTAWKLRLEVDPFLLFLHALE